MILFPFKGGRVLNNFAALSENFEQGLQLDDWLYRYCD